MLVSILLIFGNGFPFRAALIESKIFPGGPAAFLFGEQFVEKMSDAMVVAPAGAAELVQGLADAV